MSQPANLLPGPEPVETAELHFKLHCKLKVFETSTKYEGHCCILAVSQYYGLIFVGNLKGFSVISTKSLTAGVSLDEYPKKNVVLNLRPTHISVDISQKILAVVCHLKPGSVIVFFNIQSFATKNVSPFKVTSVSKLLPNVTAEVVDLTWQPNADGSFVICMSDGSVLAFPQGTKDDTMFTLPASIQATCFCWSPKGKQIVIGSANGTLSQYKPDLKLVKTLPSPPLYNGAVMVVSVLWVSSFQFAVAYNDRANPELFPVITIVNAAKNEPVSVINYDDITYSSTLFRNHQIYMSHMTAWNLIFVSSANSIEIAVLHLKDNISWEQWLLGDASRAELPLNPDRQETFPLGWAFDFTSQETIPWGEGSLPPMPRLLLVSDEGLLCVFNVVNVSENASKLCAPPQEGFDDSVFTVSSKTAPAAAPEPENTTPTEKSILGSPPTFGNSKPNFSFQPSPGFGGFTVKPQTKPQKATEPLPQQPEQTQPKILQQPQPLVQTPQLQVQQLQPQTQQQPLALSTQPQSTMAPFKLSISQLGTPQAFPFGSSNLSFTPKPAFVAEQTKVSEPTGNSFALQPSASQKNVFFAKNVPQSTPVKQQEISVEKKITPPIAFSTKSKPVEPVVGKTEEIPAKGDSETPETAAPDAGVYLNALMDEIDHFNSELQQLSSRVGNLDVHIGTEEDKIKMKKSIDGLYSFWGELKETTEGQSSEIHATVMDLMESFAWLEDAKSRNLQRKNPSYIELKKSEELDPLNARHMNEISHLKYYIENQLKQLSGHLEKEWMDHQENYRNEIKNKMAVPPLEEVYKTMHYQLKILHKQKALVEELKERIAQKKRKKFQTFIISTSNSTQYNANGNRASELSKLAENLLQLTINKEEDFPQLGAWEIMKSQLTAIAERSKKLTREKQNALRDMLSERDMVRIRPVKTTFESSTFLRSLHSEKSAAATTPKAKTFFKFGEQEQKDSAPIIKNTPKSEIEIKPDSVFGKSKTEEKFILMSENETSKSVNALPEKAAISSTVQSFGKKEEKSPLASLSGFVSALGSDEKTEDTAFVFKSSTIQVEFSKEPIAFDAEKQDQKQEVKTSQPFTFGTNKPAESIFENNEAAVLGLKLTSILLNSNTEAVTKNEITKVTPTPNITITPVTIATATTSPFSFTPVTTTSTATSFSFTAATTTASSLPKVNLSFGAKETNSGFGTPLTTKSIFSATSTTASPSQFTLSQSTASTFGAKTATTFTMPTSLFGVPKTNSEAQPSGFSVTPSSEVKSPQANDPVPAVIKPVAETEEVNVLDDDELSKKSEPALEKSKDSPKATPTPSISSPSTPPKSTSEVTSTVSTNVTTVPGSLSAPSVFSKPVATTVATASSETSISIATTASISTPATTTSVFSFASVTAPVFFGSTPTTTTTTTTSSLFGTSTTSTSIFGQVSSTTPTASIFGGSTPSVPSTNLFGGSTPVKAATDQPSTPVTTSESIFGGSIPTTNSFGQVSTPNTTTSFGQTSNVSVDTTANLFGQLLSDSNKSVFGGSSTPTTANNFFTSPKTAFEGASTTTASLFGSSFGTPVFGQPTTTASILGQPQTTASNSFFGSGQNIFSGFGKGTSQSGFKSGGFSEPVFGQSAFGQGFNRTTNTPTFGGTSGSIFGGAPTATTGNVFQTPTTSTTFGSTSPGPFSGGSSSFGESGFGSSSNTFQKPLGGFGSQPVFGGGPAAPAFGGSPTFGGSPSFGSLPTFGSVSQGAFGQSSGSTTFESLANQSTVGFGNLAQQSQGQGFGGGFGSPSFENKPAFGGNSFSSWRSH